MLKSSTWVLVSLAWVAAGCSDDSVTGLVVVEEDGSVEAGPNESTLASGTSETTSSAPSSSDLSSTELSSTVTSEATSSIDASTNDTAPSSTSSTLASHDAGETAGSNNSGDAGSDSGPSSQPIPDAGGGYHLGEPFVIVGGEISADSNAYGLSASFYANRDATESPIEITSLDGEVCVRGELLRADANDFDEYWGIVLGFTTAAAEDRTLTESSLSISPQAAFWDYAESQVLGIAFTVTGTALPNSAHFGLQATPGGQDPAGQYGVAQEHTIYGDCAAPAIETSGQVQLSFFSQLENYWCVDGAKESWQASSTVAFWWGVTSVVVEGLNESDAAVPTDAYDFCLRDIRPIVAGPEPVTSSADGG